MIKLLAFLSALILLGIVFSWLEDTSGIVTLQWLGWQVETSVFVLLAFSLLVGMVLFVFYKALEKLVTFPRNFRRQRKLEHYERGLSVLTEAFAALAVADVTGAKKLTQRADKLLSSPPITRLMAAQLAKLEGRDEDAVAYLKPLLEHKETHFIAAHSLLAQSRKSGNLPQALAYAEEAARIRPSSHYAAIALVDIYTLQQRWQEAAQAIRDARRHNALDKKQAARYQAVIEYQQAVPLYEEEDYETALPFARSAHKALPDMVPFAMLLSRLYSKLNQRRHITKVIQTTWKHTPHPSLAMLYRQLFMDDSPAKRLKRAEALAAYNPENIESQIAIAEAALDAGDFAKARNQLKIALSKQETPRICKLMARLEETEHQDKEKSAEWMQRAVKADMGPSWTCGECKAIPEKWSLHCPECHSFDTISWKVNRLNFVESGAKQLPQAS